MIAVYLSTGENKLVENLKKVASLISSFDQFSIKLTKAGILLLLAANLDRTGLLLGLRGFFSLI